MSVNFNDHSKEVLSELDHAKKNALTAIGKTAERHAIEVLTEAGRVDTGRLRNSIAHKEKGDATYIGTNVEYAPYIEFGTGIYATDGNGRKDPWVYQDGKGKFHFTRGVKPVHYLKKAITEHTDEYKQLAKDALDNG